MIQSLKKRWPIYLMELSGLAGFVIIAGLLTIFLEHPDLPVMKSSLKDYALLRRIPLGIVLGVYITIIILLFGKKSGAHINPAATWAFYRIGKINFGDAVLYTIVQFAGAIIAAQLLKYTIGNLFSHPLINYGNSEPKPPHGTLAAFIAEFIISFILMLVMLFASSSRRFEKKVALISGVLIALYLIFETPLSGMSLNPARSFAAALASDKWEYLWIYFIAPPIAMLAASEVFINWRNKQLSQSYQGSDSTKDIYTKKGYKEIPYYPVEK